MYVIVEIAGMQHKISQGKFVYIPRLKQKKGEIILFKNVLLFIDNKKTIIGYPFIENIKVKGEILSHLKTDKIIIFKKKKRKGYKVKHGHRQQITKLKIISIETCT